MADCRAPVAVFDSGLGGISVLRELVRTLPMENYLYFGDSLHAPYGTKTPEEVTQLSLQAAQKLLAQGAKALVVACNTATSAAIRTLRKTYPALARGGASSGRQNSDAGDGNDRAGGEVPAAQGAV